MNRQILLIFTLISIYCPLWPSAAQKQKAQQKPSELNFSSLNIMRNDDQTEGNTSPERKRACSATQTTEQDELEAKKVATLIAASKSFPGSNPLNILTHQKQTARKYRTIRTSATSSAATEIIQRPQARRMSPLLKIPDSPQTPLKSGSPTQRLSPRLPKGSVSPFSRPPTPEPQEKKEPEAKLEISVQKAA